MEGRLSKDGCCGTSNDGWLARLMGLEKLNAGRGTCEPPIEYSELREGDRPWAVCAKGANGEFGMDTLLLDESFLFWENPDPVVEALCSSSELSIGIDLMLACFVCGDLGGARDAWLLEDVDSGSTDIPR